MNRRVEIIVVALIALGCLALGTAAGLYFVNLNQIQFVGGEAREFVLSLNAPPGTVRLEENPSYKGVAPPAPSAVASAGPAGDWPSYNKTLTHRALL
jgi:hypothetical protein